MNLAHSVAAVIYSKFRAKIARVGTRALKNQKKLTIYSKTQVKLAHKRTRVPTHACDLIHKGSQLWEFAAHIFEA